MGCLHSKHSMILPYDNSNFQQLSDHKLSTTPSTVDIRKPSLTQDSSLTMKCPFMSGNITMLNLTNNEETKHQVEKISGHTLYGTGCQNNQCHAAMMDKFNSQKTDSARSKEQVLAEATEFLYEFYKDCHPSGLGGLQERLDAVKKSIKAKGYYFHTVDELTYGVKLCWRNASRCIMRSQWRNIKVVDARGPNAEHGKHITNEEIFEKCVDHLRNAVTTDAGGNRVISSLMTVFPQLLPGENFGRRIWNNILIRFAGYRQPDGSVLGDPANVDLTDACLQLGWRSPGNRTPFDVLPLVVQASDSSPPYLREIPSDAQLLVPIHHPEYPKLSELDIKWHAIPAIANFTCDIGGIQYPCAPFNGWYMDTEIACRNLCDVQRYNLLPAMVRAMGMDLAGDRRDLVRDRALVEMTVAVLSSFDKERITIVDHHTASESFIRHFNKEMDTRGFIPSDWVWITPPIGGSANQVFHQEMVNFFIKPNFIMPSHSPKDLLEMSIRNGLIHFEDDRHDELQGGRVRETNYIGCQSVQKTSLQNQGVYIYYGSETGVSESYAKTIRKHIDTLGGSKCKVQQFATLNECDLHQFSTTSANSVTSVDAAESKLLVIVTSTFGSGGPPGNAAEFFGHLHDGVYNESNIDLSKTKVIIFGNGSSLYTDFNKCANVIESKLRAMKASLVLSGCADERNDPEGSFRNWCAKLLTHTQCDIDKLSANVKKNAFQFKEQTYTICLRPNSTNLIPSPVKTVALCTLKGRTDLVTVNEREVSRFDFDVGENVHPEDGDHIAILPRNSSQAVSEILCALNAEAEVNKYVEVTPEQADGGYRDEVPVFLRGMYTLGDVMAEFIDLSASPTYSFIQKVSTIASVGTDDRIVLQYLALSVDHFRKWIAERSPSMADFFRLFPSVSRRLPLSVFLMNAPRIAPRLYSLSSSSKSDKNISLTVRIEYIRSENDGKTIIRRGLCSDYLWNLQANDSGVRLYVSPSPDFRLVKDVPIVMICNGTGIAPFRAFWRTLAAANGRVSATQALFYHGCRNHEDNMYSEELTATFMDDNLAIAYSRDGSSSAKYVTDLISRDASRLQEYVDVRNAKIYVCGTNSMATGVRERIESVVGTVAFEQLLETRRYVEEIF